MLPSPFQFVKDALPLIGWGIVIAFFVSLWRLSIKITSIGVDVKNRAEIVEQNVNTVMTNHLPHIQAATEASAEKQDTLAEKQEKVIELLTSMDRNIAVLVDRGR